ncbi:MAG: glycosyltransferase family 4 protein [Spirochaetales bacterium]|nr:glycosyltransferase family 4 protein [Spirochaetales bacterium]
MHIALISPIAWSTPPKHYGPWEQVVSLLAEGLVAEGIKVTLFATGNSCTTANLHSVCYKGYEEDKNIDPKVWECMHIAEVMELSADFDIIHNHFDFLPLSYSRLISTPIICTIHGFSSAKILPVYEKYNSNVYYIAISNANRHPNLNYLKTIYHGINLSQFSFIAEPGKYLLFFGRIHPDKGAKEAIMIAKQSGMNLKLAGIIQDLEYYKKEIQPWLDGENIEYLGNVNPLQRDSLLGNALALLHPINFNEPFGLSVIESMACGTPVIANNLGSMSEIIENQKNGYLVNNIKEAVIAVENINKINRINCRKIIIEKFSMEDMVKNYINAYKTILNRNGRHEGDAKIFE